MKLYLVSVQYLGSIAGSGGIYVLELSKELAKEGIEVNVITMGIGDNKEFEEIELENADKKIKVYRLWTSDSKNIKGPFEGDKKEEIKRLKDFSQKVLEFFSANKINGKDVIIHLFGHYMIPSLARQLKKISNFRIVTTLYALESISEARKGDEGRDLIKFIQKRERDSIIYSDFIIVRSNSIDEELSWMFPDIYDKNKVIIIPGGVSNFFVKKSKFSYEDIELIKRNFNISGKLFLSINRIDPAKGLEYIISAYSNAIKNYNEKSTLLIAGWLEEKNRWYYKRLLHQISKIKDKRIRDSIKIIINLKSEDKLLLYHIASFTILGFIVTPFSITLVESILKEVPFIIPGIESVLDILKVEKVVQPFVEVNGGILVYFLNPVKRVEYIEKGIQYALKNESKLKKDIKVLKPQMERYLWKNSIKLYIDVYKRLI